MDALGEGRAVWLPSYDEAGCLPAGRYPLSLDVFESVFVQEGRFADSTSRGELLQEWSEHRQCMCAIAHGVDSAWISGSFVTACVEPRDIDVTYFIGSSEYDSLDEEDRFYIENLRDPSWCKEQGWRVDSHLIVKYDDLEYWQLETPSVFSEHQRQAFMNLGLYDEVWRRNKGLPGKARRGYVEVVW